MTTSRTLVLAAMPLLIGGLAACGSSAPPATSGTGPAAAATAFQSAMHDGDATRACVYIDEVALKAQIAKSGKQYANQTCATVMAAVLAKVQAGGQSVPLVKTVTVVSQTATTAKLSVVDTDGRTSVSDWKLISGAWKLSSSAVTK
jgi:hypothetical protein